MEIRSKEGRGLQRKIREKEKKRESHQIIVSTYEGRIERMKKRKKRKHKERDVVMMIVVEVRIIGCNKVEFMAPKGSETRTNLTSFFYLTQYSLN